MPSIACPKCQSVFAADHEQPVACPKCGQRLPAPKPPPVVASVPDYTLGPVIERETSQPPIEAPVPAALARRAFNSPMSTGEQQWNATGPTGAGVFGGFFIAASILMFLSGLGPGFSPGYSYGSRFQTDNAVGATANALEYLAQREHSVRPGEVFIAGLLMILIGRVGRVADRFDSFRASPQR